MVKKVLTDREHLIKLVAAFNCGYLALKAGGTKMWRGYKLEIIELVWGRNLQDGFEVSVFIDDSRGRWEHIGDINFDFNLDRVNLEPNDEDFFAGHSAFYNAPDVTPGFYVFSADENDDNVHSEVQETETDAQNLADMLNKPVIKITKL